MSLQLKGEIPSVSEISSIADNNFQTAHWASTYIRSPEFAEYWGDYLASLFRAKTIMRGGEYAAYEKYFVDSVHQNKSYRQLARELIVSQGLPAKTRRRIFILETTRIHCRLPNIPGAFF